MKQKLINYGIAVFSLLAVLAISLYSKTIFHALEESPEHGLILVLFLTSMLFVLGTLSSHVARLTSLPSFVIAIFFGIAGKELLTPIIENKEALSVLVNLGAALILFSGGIETSFSNFKKLVAKILSLSFVGLLITGIATSFLIYNTGIAMGTGLSILTAVLLGAVLPSTDPAAIVPILKKLKFRNKSVKDIVISESAFTDVTGTLLTIIMLSLIAGGAVYASISDWYLAVFSKETGLMVANQLFFGILFGVIGYLMLEGLLMLKKKKDYGHEADLPFFLFVPTIAFVAALTFHASGYLAAFIAGLLFNLTTHLKDTEHFFNNLIEGFLKPTIFVLLGALVDLKMLISYAPIGILVALVFMFIIRPISVFLSLGVFKYFGKERISTKDMLFISFVRETGAIPAVLLVTIASLNIPGTEGLIEIGMWVILATLIIEPPLTPLVARKLGVAEEMKDDEALVLPTSPSVMIVSRGYGFIKRLDTVCDFASQNNMNKVVVLLCLEQKYTEELEKSIREAAYEAFRKENKRLTEEGKNEIKFKFISRKGLLQDNIDFISSQIDSNIATIFAGKKILDYHLSEIKRLSIPIRFID